MTAWTEARHTLGRAYIVTRREVQDQLRDWRIIFPIVILTLFFPLLMNFTAQQAVNFVTEYNAPLIADRLIPFLLMVVGFFPISISLVIALESFVGEKERHSLEPLLSSPLSDTELYIGKTLAAMLPPLAASYLGITVYMIGLALTVRWIPPATLVIQILALTTIQALLMVAAAVVISAQATSVRAANLLASFVIVPMALLVQGESLIMFWAQYDVLWWIFFGLLLVTLVLVRMGVRLFNREELLGRDIDEINFRAVWTIFALGYAGAGRGLGLRAWYGREVFPTVRRLAGPALMVVAALLVALTIGWSYAPAYRLPLEALTMTEMVKRFQEEVGRIQFATPLGALWIFLINLRALALATLLGMFSFGVLAVVLLMASPGLVGYLGAQLAMIGINPIQFLAAFILPHGVFELTAAVLAGAAILRLGASVISPPPGKTLGEGWLLALADWAKISFALVVPLLAVGALVEALVTPRVVVMIFGG